MRFIGQILGEDGKIEFGFEDVHKVDEDTLFVGEYGIVPVVLSSVKVAEPEPDEELQGISF